MKKRCQALSTDVVFAIILFLFGFMVFFHLIFQGGDDLKSLKKEGSLLPLKFMSSDNTAFIVQNKVDSQRLKRLADMDYQELKRELNLKYDFCLYFEDERGNLINISKDAGKICIGSPDARLNGMSCG